MERDVQDGREAKSGDCGSDLVRDGATWAGVEAVAVETSMQDLVLCHLRE